MILKSNLHFHTNDDPTHNIEYNTIEGIDKAADLGFQVLALTCHEKVIYNNDYKRYANSKNILLIPGVELNVGENKKEGRHLLILNCSKEVEDIETLRDLEKYKKENPGIFVMAPHPYFPSFTKKQSLMEYTEKYSHLFDAIEHSWFYSTLINKNIPAKNLAQKKNISFIATSDTHFFNFMDTDYCLIETENKTKEDVIWSLKKGSFRNITRPKKILRELVIVYGSFCIKSILRKNGFNI